MTIDEAIAHAREVAERNMKDANDAIEDNKKYDRNTDSILVFENIKANDGIIESCNKCAEQHKQIAEWLEELKEYQRDSVPRPAFEKMKVKSYQKGYRQGYSKSIDDLVIIAMKQFTDFDLKHRYQSVADYKEILRNVADQLKKSQNRF